MNIGMISTRFSGTDGVSLEAVKWADVFEGNGFRCFWFAGELDKAPQTSFLSPEAHFEHPRNQLISDQIFGTRGRQVNVTESIHELRFLLKAHLYQFIHRFDIDLLVVENALTIPMHVPLGLALSEIIAETQIPTIAHHHDFYWERTRFSISAVNDYLNMAFPPNLPNIRHVVINSGAQEQLALRTGISSTVIPNVLDFENPPLSERGQSREFRQAFALDDDDILFLQPTRIVQRKGIEHAIELVRAMGDPRCKLLISHKAGDEGFEYADWLKENACEHGVDLRLIEARLAAPGSCRREDPERFTLWDVYPHASFITYPSLSEGFGNAFLEAIYFKKPLLINRYATFVKDIEPLGFDLVVMDGFLTKSTVGKVAEILGSEERRQQMVDLNYDIAQKHYSYATLRARLNPILNDFFGDDIRALRPRKACPLPAGRRRKALPQERTSTFDDNTRRMSAAGSA